MPTRTHGHHRLTTLASLLIHSLILLLFSEVDGAIAEVGHERLLPRIGLSLNEFRNPPAEAPTDTTIEEQEPIEISPMDEVSTQPLPDVTWPEDVDADLEVEIVQIVPPRLEALSMRGPFLAPRVPPGFRVRQPVKTKIVAASPPSQAPSTRATKRAGSCPPPIYPRSARRRQLEGTVVVLLSIDHRGMPTHAAVVESSGVAVLDQAVVEAVLGWRFVPASLGGQPRNSRRRFSFRFELH